jgi:tetratricopeptide (TPR) repeat protein
MAKNWKDSETDYLKRYAKSKTLKQLVQRFGVSEAAMEAKLGELSLTSKDGRPATGIRSDPALEHFAAALKDLWAGRFEKAASGFERVVAEADQPEVAERARQLGAAAGRHLAAAEPAAEIDPFLEAVAAKNRGELDAALKLCAQGGRASKDERFAFLAASVHALAEREKEAAEALAKAVELEPKNRVHAYHDPDLAALREKKEHAHLFGLD